MKYLLALLGGFEISDGVVTHLVVGSGLFNESNPLMAPIVSGGGFVPFKVVGAIACVVALWYLYRRFPRLSMATASGIVVIYGAVMTWNLSVFLTL